MNNWKSSLAAATMAVLSFMPMTNAFAEPQQTQEVSQEVGESQASLININTAEEAELANLPGVGPKKAAAIIQYRVQVGAFTSVEELLEIKGIGPKMLEKLKSKVTL